MQRRGALGAARSRREGSSARDYLSLTIARAATLHRDTNGGRRSDATHSCSTMLRRRQGRAESSGAHLRWNEERARVRSTLHEYAEHDAQLRGNGAPIWGTQYSSPARSACVAVIVAVISLNIQHWACWFCSYLLSSPRSRRVAAAGVGSNAPSMYLKGADERDVSVAVSRVRGRWPTGFLVTCEASVGEVWHERRCECD